MRIGVVSDTHGFTDPVKKGLENLGELDLIIHLGDYAKDARSIEKVFNVKSEYVKGNSDDSKEKAEKEKVLELEGKRIFITHGHLYNVNNNLNTIFYRGLELNCDIILFGHTHIPTKLIKENILILNPGSPVIPRGGSESSIALLEIENGEINAEIINI